MEAIPSAEVLIERCRMALAEAGYPDMPVYARESAVDGWPDVILDGDRVPGAVWWLACSLVYPSQACWSCWRRGKRIGDKCLTGNCQHPEGPSRPPRELLRAS